MRLRAAAITVLMLRSSGVQADSGPWALPGLAHVEAASTGSPVALALSAGYGYTEEVLGGGDVHHRTFGGVAASFRATPWLALGARLDGRYDRHGGGSYDDASGTIDPRFTVRLARPFGEALQLGAEAGVWFPGEDGPDGAAISPRALGLLTWRRGGLAVHANAGFHLDRSGRSVDDPETLQPTDLYALGVSDSPAVLAGAGVELAVGAGTLWGEASWDLLVGGDAPPLAESPLHAVAGYRHPLGRALDLIAFVDVDASSRPDFDAMAPLQPIGPRVAAAVAVAYRFEDEPSVAPVVAEPRTAPPTPALPPPPEPGSLAGRLVGPNGPIAGATVSVGDKSAVTDADGRFELTGLPPGAHTVRVEKPGFKKIERALSVTAGQKLALDLAGEVALPDGQIRGTVLSFDGKPLAARIRITPGNLSLTADAQGAFQVDVPPGDYEVVVEMPGYAGSKRRVKVEQRGVTVLPIDLKRK